MESAKLKALLLAALVSTILVAANTHRVNPDTSELKLVEQSLLDSKQDVDSKQVADSKQAADSRQVSDPQQKVPLILQTNASNCGLASLAMLLSLLFAETGITGVARAHRGDITQRKLS